MSLIFLVGFMGSGKTSIGSLLATYLEYNFVDLDNMIVKESKLTINEIFAQYGEIYFRSLETKLLQNIINYKNTVISLGGGTYIKEENRNIIKQYGISIWLQCDLQTILDRLANDNSRPLYSNPIQMQELLDSRLIFYQQADFSINVTKLTIEEAVNQIQKLLLK
jgi:shikimate kinase